MTEHLVHITYPQMTGNNQHEHAVRSYTKKGGGIGYKAKVFLKQETETYRTMVHGQLFAQKKSGLKLRGPLEVEWRINPPDWVTARDSDNLRKVCADALTKAGFWTDDSNKVIRREVFEWLEAVPGGRILVIARPYRPSWEDQGMYVQGDSEEPSDA